MKELQPIKKELRLRLSHERICHEHYYIQNMNPRLQISLDTFLKDPKHTNISPRKIINVLESIDILQKINKNPNKTYFRLVYPQSDTIILITGINKNFIERFLEEFKKYYQGGTKASKIIYSNQFWISVELQTRQQALAFKKLLRNRKKTCDMEQNLDYKIQKKRVRIVIQNQDFFTILVDAMSQMQNKKFLKQFGQQNDKGILYKQIVYKCQNPNQIKNQLEFQDNYSQQQSRTSQAVDSSKEQDLIETIDQGIQAGKTQENIQKQQKKISKEKQNTIIIQHNKDSQISIQSAQQDKFNNLKRKNYISNLNNKKNNYNSQCSIVHGQDITLKQDGNNNYNNNKNDNHQNNYNQNNNNDNNSNHQNNNKNNKESINNNIINKQKQRIPQLSIQKQIYRYDYLKIKKLYRQSQKINHQNIEKIIPDYLLKEDQKQRYRKQFFNGIWKQSKYGHQAIWKNTQ